MGKVKYQEIGSEERSLLEEDFYTSIVDNYRRDKVKDNIYKYEVVLQQVKFVTYMTDEEVRAAVGLAIDLLEELKEINNSGMDKAAYEKLVAKIESEEKKEELKFIYIWKEITTERLRTIIEKIDIVCRVGGSYALLIANPFLMNAIDVVYEKLVDEFDNEELYQGSGYFLLRAIMKMHSEELD